MAGKGGGGAWKVAYADFVTAMMAFFLVMWITSQSKPIKESVASYFNDPFGGPATRPNGSSFKRTLENGDAPYTRGKQKNGAGQGGPSRRKTIIEEPSVKKRKKQLFLHGGDRSYVGTMLTFNESSAEIDAAGKKRLDELIPLLAGKPNKIEVRGHSTGRRPAEDSPYHNVWELCFARCEAALDYLEEHGIEAERIRLSQAGSYDRQPFAHDQQRLADRSRVEVYMLNEYVGEVEEGAGQAPVDETAAAEGDADRAADAHAAEEPGAAAEPARHVNLEAHAETPTH